MAQDRNASTLFPCNPSTELLEGAFTLPLGPNHYLLCFRTTVFAGGGGGAGGVEGAGGGGEVPEIPGRVEVRMSIAMIPNRF